MTYFFKSLQLSLVLLLVYSLRQFSNGPFVGVGRCASSISFLNHSIDSPFVILGFSFQKGDVLFQVHDHIETRVGRQEFDVLRRDRRVVL